jgi:hypothetical protein
LQVGHRKKNAGQKALKMQEGVMRHKQTTMTISMKVGSGFIEGQRTQATRSGPAAKKNAKQNPTIMRLAARGSLRMGAAMMDVPLLSEV